MARRKYRALRIGGWILLGFFSLILLVTLVFYLGRGLIMDKAVAYLNEQQPGEVQMEKMNLIPFINFPNVSLQLVNVTYFERKAGVDTLPDAESHQGEPLLSLGEVSVTLDIIDLIRGDIQVSQAVMEDGFILLEIYEDSVTNLEHALGLRFNDKPGKETPSGLPALKVDLEKIGLTNIEVNILDRTRDNHVTITINLLESNFSFLPAHIEAGLNLDLTIHNLKYLTYRSETDRNIVIDSEVQMNPLSREVVVKPSLMRISGLELETWGTYDFLGKPHLDFAFKARNEGLEVLNYLFRGILDLDEIEQIGSGSISMNGNITGFLGDQLPVIRINGEADQIGFRIKSIKKDVTDISFKVFATNGAMLDFSGGIIQLDGFKATFPEGTIKANISASNMRAPNVNIDLKGDINLTGLEKMLKDDLVKDLKGFVSLKGSVSGVINKKTGEFLNDAGSLRAQLRDVGFVIQQDSVVQDSIQELNGEIFVQENIIGTSGLALKFNGNHISAGANIENLLVYLMDFETDVKADISISSEILHPATFIRDTSVSGLLGEEIKGLHFRAGAVVSSGDLDAFFGDDSIPSIELSLDSFGVELPVFSDISNMNAALTFGPDSITLHQLTGTIGESEFSLAGKVGNYSALIIKDSAAAVDLHYQVSSDRMRAEDFFTLNDVFVLPETFRTEYLEDFSLAGSIALPAAGLLYDSVSLDFGLKVEELGWKFRYYPFTFEQFLIQIRRKGDQLYIDNLQGKVGESNLKMSATIGNFTDSLIENLYGSLVLESDLLDFNELLNYQLPEELLDTTALDTAEVREPPRLDQIAYPEFNFQVNIGEVRYGDYKIFGMNGKFRSTRDKIFYLDSLITSAESGGSMEFNGQFNVASSWMYTFSTKFDVKDVDISDLNLEMQSGEDVIALNEKFNGVVSTNGIAEIFITPDLKIDMSTTTAVFNAMLKDGAIINFLPLQAAAKYLDNKDLNHVKFATLSNGMRSFTLVDSRITIPLMSIESTIGQLLIEGEQGLDNSYLYLLRLPTWLVKGAAKSRLSNSEGEEQEDQIQEMKNNEKFLKMTAWGDGVESEVKLGDKRDKYQE